PLFLACQAGAADIAEFLIVLGAKTTIRNDKGKSPLDVATQACIYMKPNRK
ncbi:MAG: ankyrin repeat domain-containing protein, partial [Gemmatimonadetes bacterium]|nr:ankyrin repeat domain-containing protein [Gemmatimonadota bacterium]